jgi:hypothetical protein
LWVTLPPTDPQLATALAGVLRKARIVYIIVGIFALVVAQVGARIALSSDWEAPLAEDGEPIWVLRIVLASMVVADFVAVGVVRRKTLRSDRPITSGLFRIDAPAPLQRLFTVSLVTGLFVEATVIYGVLLALAGGAVWDVVVFGAAALVGFAVTFPRRAVWEEYALGSVLRVSAPPR